MSNVSLSVMNSQDTSVARRTSTFRGWNHAVWSSRLVFAGFHHDAARNVVTCSHCGLDLAVPSLQQTMNPSQIHRERRPDCPFVQGMLCFIWISEDAIKMLRHHAGSKTWMEHNSRVVSVCVCVPNSLWYRQLYISQACIAKQIHTPSLGQVVLLMRASLCVCWEHRVKTKEAVWPRDVFWPADPKIVFCKRTLWNSSVCEVKLGWWSPRRRV